VDNTAQVQGGLRGTLGEEYRADLVGVLILNYSKTRRGSKHIDTKVFADMYERNIGKTM